MNRLNTKELMSHFNSLTNDVHRKAAILNERLSRIESAPDMLTREPIVRKVIALTALNHRLIAAGTEMINEGVEGGGVKLKATS